MGNEGSRDGTSSSLDDGWFERNRTFKPRKKYGKPGSRKDTLSKTLNATLRATLSGSQDVQETVRLPEGEDVNEWLAVNTVHFFNTASLLYGTIREFCNDESCPKMTAGSRVEYMWPAAGSKKPVRTPAPVYISQMLDWVDTQISDPGVFPVDEGDEFPSDFKQTVDKIFTRMFRLYAHVYRHHFARFRDLGAEAHLNTVFKQFLYFLLEFDLMPKKEFVPLEKLVRRLIPAEKATQLFDR